MSISKAILQSNSTTSSLVSNAAGVSSSHFSFSLSSSAKARGLNPKSVLFVGIKAKKQAQIFQQYSLAEEGREITEDAAVVQNVRAKVLPEKTVRALMPNEAYQYFKEAIKKDNEWMVLQLIERRSLTQAYFTKEGLDPLCDCVEHQAVNVLGLLLMHYGWHVMGAHRQGCYHPIHLAIDLNRADCLEILLDTLSVEDTKQYAGPFLSKVVAVDQSILAEILLRYGVDANMAIDEPLPVFLALFNRNAALFELLLNRGASVALLRERMPESETLLEGLLKSCIEQDIVSSFLLYQEKNIFDLLVQVEGLSVLQYAILHNAQKIVQHLLLLKQPQTLIMQNGSFSPLQLAIEKQNKEWVNALLQMGSEINYQNSQGETALICAAKKDLSDWVELLCVKKADVSLCDHQGDTALHIATQQGDFVSARALLTAGADVEQKNQQGKSPYSLAREYGQRDILSLFSLSLLEKM